MALEVIPHAKVRPAGLPDLPLQCESIEAQTSWSIRKFVRTARRCRTTEIQAGPRTITATHPLPTTSAGSSKASTAPALGGEHPASLTARADLDYRVQQAE